ncbi:amidohydrolase family protein [Myxococcota bacterium]|nr:amidohydrolase family protein [Myxococcota bacterium]
MTSRTQRLLVVSADCHAGPSDMWGYRDYVEARNLGDFDEYCRAIDEYDDVRRLGDGHGGGAPAHSHELEAGLWDAAIRSRYLDSEGLAGEVVFAQGSVPFGRYPAVAGPQARLAYEATPELRDAGPAIYNRWLADLCATEPGRRAGVAMLPIRDPIRAAAEVENARASGLFGGIALPPVSDDFPKYNDPCYEDLWRACEMHDMPINLHGGANMYYGEGPESTALILSETDFFSHRALSFMIFSGVLERFPDLRVAITEQRTHWVGPLLWELDSIFESPLAAGVREILSMRPSEYFARQCFIGASFLSRPECERRHDIGVDRIMWGSDFPHMEGTWPWTSESLRWTFESVPSNELGQMLGGNAARCYTFDTDALRRAADRVGPFLDDLRRPVVIPQDERARRSFAFRQKGPWS